MRLERRRPIDLHAVRVCTVVVMDVLRMTSTAAVLMRRPSCNRVAVASTVADLDRLGLLASECVVVSELPRAPEFGTWVDNSPVQVAELPFGERTPVLVTTNGTRALLAAAACADRVLLASFLDVHAVAQHLAARPTPSVVLLPAGNFATGEACVEDDLCADALESLLAGREPDFGAFAAVIRSDPRICRRLENEPGFAADLDFALQGDRGTAVLEFQALDMGVGCIVRA